MRRAPAAKEADQCALWLKSKNSASEAVRRERKRTGAELAARKLRRCDTAIGLKLLFRWSFFAALVKGSTVCRAGRCDLQLRDVPFYLQDFTDRQEGRYGDVDLRCPCTWSDYGLRAQEARGDKLSALPRLYRAVSSIEKVPSGARWVHEINFNGYRLEVHLVN